MCADPLRTCKSFNGSFANGCYDFADLEEGTGQLQTGKTQTYFFTHPAWGDYDGVLDTDELWRPDCQFMSSLFRMAQEVDPHVMMIVFLPTLLFESAFAMDYAIFRKQLSQIVVLAGPGVIVASLVTGLFVKAWYSHWSFNACWLLGTIVSATDPVAVVALLKDLGADPALGTMIEGESLLNDGSAVVVYSFIMSWIKFDWEAPDGWLAREDLDKPEPFPVWGSGLDRAPHGAADGGARRRLRHRGGEGRQRGAAASVQRDLHRGGDRAGHPPRLLALRDRAQVVGGALGGGDGRVYLNLHREAITVDTQHFLHEFYEMCAYLLNTVLFLIAGCYLGDVLQRFVHGNDDDGVVHTDISFLIILYLVCIFARAIAILVCYPALRRLGTGMEPKTAVVLLWGGLRGAVGLALAIMVHHTQYDGWLWKSELAHQLGNVDDGAKYLYCRDVPEVILMATCFIILTTVCINGSTMAPLMKCLALDKPSAAREYMLADATKKLIKGTNKKLDELKNDKWVGAALYNVVRQKYVVPPRAEHAGALDRREGGDGAAGAQHRADGVPLAVREGELSDEVRAHRPHLEPAAGEPRARGARRRGSAPTSTASRSPSC